MSETAKERNRLAKAYKSEIQPVWCPGCGHFAILSALTKSLAEMEMPKEDVAVISGIGCSSRLPAYLDTYGFHGIHGRALPLASGLKAMRSDLTVVVVGGDGDGFSIGGNHFMHACRRNMDMTYVVMDNEVYGMTKGQASPTTDPEWESSKLTPHGTQVRALNPAAIALASGATFIARGFSGHPLKVVELISQGIQHKGFSFIQVLSPCTTFQPEEKNWKHIVRDFEAGVTDDVMSASHAIHGDDGFSLGVIYKSQQPVWQPPLKQTSSLHEIEQMFKVMG